MAGHKAGNSQIGGDAKTRKKVKANTKPGPKHGGKPRKGPKITAFHREQEKLRRLAMEKQRKS